MSKKSKEKKRQLRKVSVDVEISPILIKRHLIIPEKKGRIQTIFKHYFLLYL